MPRIRSLNVLLAVLALAICTGTLQAAITTSPSVSAIALTCDLVNGPGAAQSVGIVLTAAGSASVTASVPANSPVAITTATQTVASTTAPVTFQFKVAAGCAGVTTSPQAVTITFTPATGSAITVQANITITNWIVAVPATAINLTCDIVQGPGPAQPVNIKLASGSSPVSVTVTASSLPAVLPGTATQSVSSSSTATVFNFQAPAGCAGLTSNPQTVPLTFTAGGVSGPAITVNAIITVTGSPVSVTPNSVSLSCNKGGGVTSQTINVTSTASGGTHFYVSASPATWPTWLTALSGPGSSSSATANATAQPVSITLTPTVCTTTTAGTYGATLYLVNSPAASVPVYVNLTVGNTNPLTATPSPVAVSYTKAAGSNPAVANAVAVTLHNSITPTSVFYTLDTTTLPSWLNVDVPSTAFTTATKALNFTATSACAALALGSYSANIHFKVTGYVDLVVTVNLMVQNPASSLSLVEGTGKTINWVMGTTIPTVTITPISTDQPIEYNVTFSGIVLSVTPGYGIAYSFGSPITITLDPSKINGEAPGTPLTGTVTVTPTGTSGGALSYVITFNVLSPGSQVTGIFPAALPVASSGTFNVTLTGSGFVKSTDPTQQTKVGVVTSGYIIVDGNIAVTVVNSTTITLVFTVQPGDPLLPFSSSNTVYLGVCNPGGTACSAPTTVNSVVVGQIALSIGSVPIIQAVTSAASFIQATPPSLSSVAPYDILSIFGTNFCMLGATGCTGANATLYGQINPVTLQYENSLTPDQTNYLTVKFLAHGTSTVLGSPAPLLFATNGQINVLVPDAVAAKAGSVVDIVVTYGLPSSTTNYSLPYSVMIAKTDPGVFTVGGDGVGPAAALDHNYNLISSTNPAGFGATGSSDTVTLYVTGLGEPDTDGTALTAWSGAKCITTTAYYNLVLATGTDPLSDDGLVMQSALYVPQGDALPPCFKSNDVPASSNLPIVKIGGVSGTVTYAGWTPDSVAGLYQIDVTLPSTTAITSGAPNFVDATGATVTWADLAGETGWPLPVVISSYGAFSQQTGVFVNVMGRLKVTAPTYLSGATGVDWPTGATTSFTVAGGPSSASYTFSTSSSMPAGLTLNSDGTVTGTGGGITTTGTYPVTVTVSDSVSGFTGSVTVTFTITGS